MTRFTRATYRRARSRAIARALTAHDTYIETRSRDAWIGLRVARWEAEQIVARARREKGMWNA